MILEVRKGKKEWKLLKNVWWGFKVPLLFKIKVIVKSSLQRIYSNVLSISIDNLLEKIIEMFSKMLHWGCGSISHGYHDHHWNRDKTDFMIIEQCSMFLMCVNIRFVTFSRSLAIANIRYPKIFTIKNCWFYLCRLWKVNLPF